MSNPISRLYDRMARVYDLAYGPVLQPGRRRAVSVMAPEDGARVLEVGVGTGLTLPLYPESCQVTGIDFSPMMLDRARARAERAGRHPLLCEMDAQHLSFADGSFDIVYAPYVLTVVPDPVRVLKEMWRVCRHAGRIVVLNHFRSSHPLWARVEQWLSPRTERMGFKADVSREVLQQQAGMRPFLVEAVNWPRLWTLMVFRKER